MTSTMTASERRLEQYREYLQLLAALQLPLQLHAKVHPADVVQQSLVKAHGQLVHFRGQTASQFAAWLRRLLAHTMTDHIDKVQVKLNLERRLVVKIDESAARLEAWLAGLAIPSGEQPQRHERGLRLSNALGAPPKRSATCCHDYPPLVTRDEGNGQSPRSQYDGPGEISSWTGNAFSKEISWGDLLFSKFRDAFPIRIAHHIVLIRSAAGATFVDRGARHSTTSNIRFRQPCPSPHPSPGLLRRLKLLRPTR